MEDIILTKICFICKEECNKYNPDVVVKCETTNEDVYFCQKCYKKEQQQNIKKVEEY